MTTFEKALEQLKNGYPICRKSWKPGTFICLQVEADINKEIIPKMQSLSEHVKCLLDNDLHYRNQCIIITPSTEGYFITSYTPTWEDILAEDWSY